MILLSLFSVKNAIQVPKMLCNALEWCVAITILRESEDEGEATSSQTCKVVIESSSRSILNLLNFGANKGNISDLSDYINNEVYKLCQPEEFPMVKQVNEHSTIRIVKPEIKIR